MAFYYYSNNPWSVYNTVKIDEVVSEKRGQRTGNGSAIMRIVTETADKNNTTLTLTPNLIGGMKAKGFETPKKLEAFYEKFGFVKDKQKATMTRLPKQVEVTTVSPSVSPEPIIIKDIIKDIRPINFAPENAIEIQEETKEDTSGNKYSYNASITAQALDQDGRPVGTMTKISDGEGKFSFTVKDINGRNINDGKVYPEERDAKVALADYVNKQITKTKDNEQVQSKRPGDGRGRTDSRKTTPLKGAPTVRGINGPDPQLVAVAEQYAAANGIDLKRQSEYVEVDEERAKRIADAYEQMPNDPKNPKVKEAYKELIKQTTAQYKALVDAGYKFWFMNLNIPSNVEYASSPYNALRDMRENKEMGVFPSTDGFGTSDLNVNDNPLLEDTGFKWPVGGLDGEMKSVLANDLFRAVHDAFGHGLEGAGFRARGEENAWQAHVRLFTGSAIPALTSETRGQNSYVNFGPNGIVNQKASVDDTVFADQKVGLMPEFTWTEGRAGDMQATTEPVTAKQAAKEKTPDVDAVIEEDANAEGVLERSLDFLDNASKSIGKRLKTNANDALLGIPLSTLKLAIDAARVLVRAGVALRDAIAKVSKDYNLAAKDVEESLKVVSEQAEKEAAAAMPMSADNVKYSDSDVLPKPDKKVSNSTVAKLLQEVAANFWGGSIVTSETITPEQERLITINGTEETIRAFESSDKNAADWYSKAIETAVAVAGVIHPELSSVEAASKIEAFAKEKDPVKAAQMALRMALAITSQNLNVDANTTYAEEQFNYYKKNGKFDPSKKYGAKAPAISSNLKLANLLIDKLGLNGAENFVSQDFTVNQLEEAFQKATGKKVKISGLRNDDVNGAAIFGPKIGQGFLQNLMGKFDPVTIDLWMRRTWGRWTGDVVGTGVTDKRMARLILAVNEAVKNKEIPKSLIPKEFFEYKPIQEKNEGGDLFWTMNDKFNDRIENDLDFLDVLNKFTKELTRQANNLYKAVHDIPMTKELYGKFLSGEMSYFEVANKLMSLDSKLKDNYSKYVANQKSKGLKVLSLNDKKVNDEIVKGYKSTEYARLGNTYSPSNEEISQRKPIWGNAAKNIVVDLNPIDIPSNLDRRVITRVVNNIKKNVNARGYNVTNADVQALLWYPEKDIWAKLRGEDESILKLSYDDQFIKIAKERGLGKQAEAVAEDIRGRRTESDVRKDDRRTDGKVSSRVDELAEIDVKTPNNAEIVINFLDGVDKAIAKVLKTQANDVLLAIPLTAIRGMIKGIKALVETGVKLRDAINRIAAENNITQEKLKDILDLASIQEEFNTLMNKADKLIANQKLKNIPEKKIVSNLDTMVRKFYENLDINDAQRKLMEREARARMGVEPRKAASIGRVLGVLKDITNVTRQEKLKIISRIRELSRDVAKDLAAEIRELAASGKITANQAASIVARTLNINPLNEASVTNFVDYMAKVFSKADYVGKMTTALSKIKQAKKNIKTKIGVAQDLFEPLNQLLSINPTLIPLNQLEKYLGILEDFGERKAVLTVKDRVKVLKQVNEILEEISNEQSRVDVLADMFNNYDGQVFNEEDGLDYAATIKKMVDDGKISTDEADLMKKYKSDILPQVEPTPATDAEIEADKKKEIKILKELKIDNKEFPLPSRDEKEDALNLAKLIKGLSEADLMNLSLTDLKNIIKVIGNINNGYLPHYAKISIEKLNSIPKGDVLSKAIERAKPLSFSKLYSRAKEKLTDVGVASYKKTMDELIKANPIYYIGDVFGDFKTKDIFNSLFEKSAQALSTFNSELKIIDQKIEAAQNKVLASFYQNSEEYLMSKFRMTAYMLQREYESNIGKKGVKPVADYLKATIKHIRKGNSVFKEADAEKLQKILEEVESYTKEGVVDLDKFYNTFNSAEKNAVEVMTEINASLGEKASYTASVIRGNKVELMDNYFHHNVLHEQNPMDETAAPEFSSNYSNSMKPSTKAKSLIERTDALTPLNFDLFTSTYKGAKFVLLDYNLTSPIRTARRTLIQAEKNLQKVADKKARDEAKKKGVTDENKLSKITGIIPKQQRDIYNAINNAYEEALDNILTNNIVQDPLANEVVDFIQKQGYRAALAGTVRFKAELASNIANALIINPKGFAKGIMNAKLIASANGPQYMKNAKSKMTSRFYASDALSGRMVDPQILKQTSGIKGSVSKGALRNRTLQIYNLTLKKILQNPVEFIADTMTTTPDKVVSLPLWFGSFMNEF